MTFSPLTNGTAPHHNKFSSRFNTPIKRVIVHHWAGVRGGDSRLTNPNEEVSANYILYSDGRLVGQVPEENRAWTSGSPAADNQSITVETQNTEVGGDWPVSDAAIAKLTELIADVAQRYGWGGVGDANVIGHREVFATACPGPYLFSRLPAITENANAMVKGGSVSTITPAASGSVSDLADAVMRGDYGNGPARKAALGARYDEVQAEVNRRLSAPAPAPAPTPEPESAQRVHTVVSGDTLWGIAEKYYGNGADWPRIHEANSGQIANPNLIFPGQEFIIP
jgi:LysM repeat protein